MKRVMSNSFSPRGMINWRVSPTNRGRLSDLQNLNYKQMKYIVRKIWLLLVVVGLTACNEDFLDIPVLVNPSPDSIDPLSTVTAAYNMNISGNASGYPNIRWNNWQTFIQGDAISDDAFKGGSSPNDQAPWRDVELFRTGTLNTRVSQFWDAQYKKIYITNWAISMVNDSDLPPALKNRSRGELYFLRSLNYFWLNRAFGGVTPVFEAGQDAKVARATEAEIYRKLETDLLYAISVLPEEYDEANLGRATKGAAQTLLAKIYLYQQKYQECFDVCREIIQSQKYELVGDFMNLWNRGWISNNVYEFSKESIFEFVSAPFPERRNPADWAGAQRPRQPDFGLTTGWGMNLPTLDLLDAFETGDPRIVSTFLFNGDLIVRGNGTFAVDAGFDQGGANEHSLFSRKVVKPLHQAPIDHRDNNGENFIVFRYADVLLMYAEAANEIGNTGEALAKLNQVRARARNSSRTDRSDLRTFINFNGVVPGMERSYLNYDWSAVQTASVLPDITTTSKDQLRNIIWNERRVEFAMEGERFYDLVRQSKVVPNRVGNLMRAFANRWDNEKGRHFVDGVHERFPIPQSEIDVTGSDLIPQNNGY